MSIVFDDLVKTSKEIRKKIIRMAHHSQSSHSGSALSAVDILTVLYFKILHLDPSNALLKTRDRFILSKGHACMALYATLAQRGFFPDSFLDKFYVNDGALFGHPVLHTAPGIEASTGSLGHGLSLGVGIATALKFDAGNSKPSRVFVLLGDGECDEGSVWEAALFAPQAKLDNLIAIVDYNKIQSFGRTADVVDLEPFAKKWESFGWAVKEVDGHDPQALAAVLGSVPFEKNKPSLVLAHTVKGKGVSFMEDKLEWHYKSPNSDQAEIALAELNSL